jgi:hypothetical protein
MESALWLLAFGLLLSGGIVHVKLRGQRARDRDRQTYTLAFPHDLSSEQVLTWIHSISGTLRSGPYRFLGVPTLAFELWATDRGIVHRLKVPWTHADYIISQLRSLVPGVRVSPEDELPRHQWTRVVEVGETNPRRSLRILNGEALSASLLASCQELEPGEAILMQWVVSPAIPERLPEGSGDETADRRQKLAEPNMLAVLRVAARASTQIRATHLLYKVRAALSSVHSPHNRFKRRLVPVRRLAERVAKARAVFLFPMELSATELVSLVAWPIGHPHVAGLPAGKARHLPATEAIAREGKIVAVSNFPGAERPLALSAEAACKHLHIVGPTGVGKTTLLGNLIVQDMEAGHGVILLEAKGDLFDDVLDRVPKGRLDDVIVVDVTDTSFPVGFNILSEGNPRAVVEELGDLFKQLYSDARGVFTQELLFHGLMTLTTRAELTFCDLVPLFIPMTNEEAGWRDELIRSLVDRELRNFWQRFDNMPRAEQDRNAKPVMDRVWQLNARPEIRHIIGQSKSSFTMREIRKGNKILLINLAGLGKDTASLVGTLLLNALWGAVQGVRVERPTFLYLDEFQDFLRLPVSPEDMLSKARGFALGMTLAHQHLGQLSTDMRQAILANARSKVVFQTTADDAGIFAREFGSLTDHDFMNLDAYEVVCLLATATRVSSPVTGVARPPAPRTGSAGQVRKMSRQRYGRRAAEVEAEIASRRKVSKTNAVTRKRPKLGKQRMS